MPIPNHFRFSDGNVLNNTLTKGAISVAVNSVDYGYTVSGRTFPSTTGQGTGFWNGITPPENVGYTIVEMPSSTGTTPNIWVARTEQEMVNLGNSLFPGNGFTTAPEVCDYIRNINTVIAVNRDYEDIVTDAYYIWDPGYTPSYCGTGQNVYDLSQNAPSLVSPVLATIGWNGEFGGVFNFQSILDLATESVGGNTSTEANFSICMWVRPGFSGAAVKNIFSHGSPKDALRSYLFTSDGTFWFTIETGLDVPSTWYIDNSFQFQSNQWQYLCFTHTDGNVGQFYLSGVTASTTSSLGDPVDNSNNRVFIGTDWEGMIGPIQFYQRVLSSSEILQNYNAQLPRFTGWTLNFNDSIGVSVYNTGNQTLPATPATGVLWLGLSKLQGVFEWKIYVNDTQVFREYSNVITFTDISIGIGDNLRLTITDDTNFSKGQITIREKNQNGRIVNQFYYQFS